MPLGVILFIYESRPNVTSDAAALCLKASNAVILRGGSEAKESNAAIVGVLSEALASDEPNRALARQARRLALSTLTAAVLVLILFWQPTGKTALANISAARKSQYTVIR